MSTEIRDPIAYYFLFVDLNRHCAVRKIKKKEVTFDPQGRLTWLNALGSSGIRPSQRGLGQRATDSGLGVQSLSVMASREFGTFGMLG